MGSKTSKPSTTSRHTRDLRDPYRDLANRQAHTINAQNPNGLGHAQIAAAVRNPKGKDPLILMLRQNDEGKYAYDQEHYDRCEELLRNNGEGVWVRAKEGRRGTGNIDMRLRRQRDEERGEERGEGGGGGGR